MSRSAIPLRRPLLMLGAVLVATAMGFGLAVVRQDAEWERVVRHWEAAQPEYRAWFASRTGLGPEYAVSGPAELDAAGFNADDIVEWWNGGLEYERSRYWQMGPVPPHSRGRYTHGLTIRVRRRWLAITVDAEMYIPELDRVDPEWPRVLREIFEGAGIPLRVRSD